MLYYVSLGKTVQMGLAAAAAWHLDLSAGPKSSNIRCAVKANNEPMQVVLLQVIFQQRQYVSVVSVL